jgi:DNA helicase-2/ATP-dependent DNA helicase PcrA
VLAADLHLHSRHAGGVSPAMTLPNIAAWAQRKGLDLLGTGDCLQEEWLGELESGLVAAESGLWTLHPAIAGKIAAQVPERLQRPLRFVLSAEVCCAPPGTPELVGLHHLLYFPSFEAVQRFRERLVPLGDLREGRPTLALDSHRLLALVLEQGDGCHLAPAHVFNPWYSSLGSVSGGRTLEDVFGDSAAQLIAVETGLTSTPMMCRRMATLDRHGLFCCSDAHSLENLGRECLLLDIQPDYSELFAALREGTGPRVRGMIKFPIERTRFYRNRCGICRKSFDGTKCPRCGRTLAIGSRDRLETIASRPAPLFPDGTPPCLQILPLAYVIAELMGVARDSKGVRRICDRVINAVGHERHVLAEASYEELAEVGTPQLARALIAQRTHPPQRFPETDKPEVDEQLSLGW